MHEDADDIAPPAGLIGAPRRAPSARTPAVAPAISRLVARVRSIRPPRRLSLEGSLPAYIGAIALSAFLLFSLELMAGRQVLPVFGGSPGVWITGLCFFTGILFLGYAYAHVVATRLTPVRGGLLQFGLALVAAISTALAPGVLASLRLGGMPETLNVLLVLLVIAGPAAFVLASTTPLLSTWFAREGDPWWLYAVSNAASFLGLLASQHYDGADYIRVYDDCLGLKRGEGAWSST